VKKTIRKIHSKCTGNTMRGDSLLSTRDVESRVGERRHKGGWIDIQKLDEKAKQFRDVVLKRSRGRRDEAGEFCNARHPTI